MSEIRTNLLVRRLYLIALFIPLVIDCALSVFPAGESFSTTLSAKAHEAREKGHKYWGWTADKIDAVFAWWPIRQQDHCRVQWVRERYYGGVWKAFAADWRGEVMPKQESRNGAEVR